MRQAALLAKYHQAEQMVERGKLIIDRQKQTVAARQQDGVDDVVGTELLTRFLELHDVQCAHRDQLLMSLRVQDALESALSASVRQLVLDFGVRRTV